METEKEIIVNDEPIKITVYYNYTPPEGDGKNSPFIGESVDIYKWEFVDDYEMVNESDIDKEVDRVRDMLQDEILTDLIYDRMLQNVY
jgi:hypothetical protein